MTRVESSTLSIRLTSNQKEFVRDVMQEMNIKNPKQLLMSLATLYMGKWMDQTGKTLDEIRKERKNHERALERRRLLFETFEVSDDKTAK